jgi:hypothetical protein
MAFIFTGLAYFADLGVQFFGMKSARPVVTTCTVHTSASAEFYLLAMIAILVGAVYARLYTARRTIIAKWEGRRFLRALTGTRTMLNSFERVKLDRRITMDRALGDRPTTRLLRNKSYDYLQRSEPSYPEYALDSVICCLGGSVGFTVFGTVICIIMYIASGSVVRDHDCHTHVTVTLKEELSDAVMHVPDTILLGKFYELVLYYMWYGLTIVCSMIGAVFGCCRSRRRSEPL